MEAAAATVHDPIRVPIADARGTCMLVLTGSNSRLDVDRAGGAGAVGYVTKDRIAAELIDAIVAASRA